MQFIMTSCYVRCFRPIVLNSKKLPIIMLNNENLSASCSPQRHCLLYIVEIAADALGTVFRIGNGRYPGKLKHVSGQSELKQILRQSAFHNHLENAETAIHPDFKSLTMERRAGPILRPIPRYFIQIKV